jgi:ABC-2 type transport system ATP-binding protein
MVRGGSAEVDESRQVDLWFRGVSHTFGATRALIDIDLALSGGVVGLLGPNGAGKSTLMNIASTALPPQHGDVLIAGFSAEDPAGREGARRSLGYLPQRFSVMSWATCRRNVTYAAWAQGIAPEECETRADAALTVVGLDGLAGRRVRTLSGGQRQRLGIACAIVHGPRVLLLDEPTVGLDPVQRSEIRDHLRSIGDGRTVLVSTHIVEDLDRIADRILVLDHGRVIFDGVRDQLINENTAPTDSDRSLEGAYVRLMRGAARGGAIAR